MARTVPAPPIAIPSDANFGTGVDIQAGSGALPGRLLDLVELANLAYATVCADCLWAQTWADGQAVQGATAGYVLQTTVRILPISSQHTTVTCSIYAASPSGTANVRFGGVNAGTTVVIGPIGAVAAWYSATLSVAGGFGPGYEDITMEWEDDLTVHSVRLIYEHHDPSGLWPGADGAFAAGALEGATVWPLDTVEAAADLPYSAALLQRIRAILAHVQARPRPVAAAAVPELANPAIAILSVGSWPHRVAYLADSRRTLRVWSRGVDNTATFNSFLHCWVGPLSYRAIWTTSGGIGWTEAAAVPSTPWRLGSSAAPDGIPLAGIGAPWAAAEFLPSGTGVMGRWVEPPYEVAGRLEWIGAESVGFVAGGSEPLAVSVWEV